MALKIFMSIFFGQNIPSIFLEIIKSEVKEDFKLYFQKLGVSSVSRYVVAFAFTSIR